MKFLGCAAHKYFLWSSGLAKNIPSIQDFWYKMWTLQANMKLVFKMTTMKVLGEFKFFDQSLQTRLGKRMLFSFFLIASNLNSFQVPTGKRDFFHHQERPVCGQFHYEGLYGGHSSGQKVHLHRKSVFYGIRVRLAWRPRCALLQRHSNGNHAANLWGHCRIQAVWDMKWCIHSISKDKEMGKDFLLSFAGSPFTSSSLCILRE